MKLADAVAGALRDWDLRYLFGVSGANIEGLHDAVHRLDDDRLRSVLAKSEIGAAFMADTRARVHHTLGVCCATSGGGMMNLAVGIAESYTESVPVLALVGQVPSRLAGRGGFQDSSGRGRTVDATAMFRAISKYVELIDSADGFWEKLHNAALAALSGRPGPAVLMFSRDAFELEVEPRPAWFPATLAELTTPPHAGTDVVRVLGDLLRTAKRPVLLVGTGVDRSPGGAAAVHELAVRAGIPVVTTMHSAGTFPHADPLFLGVVGAAGHPSAHAYLNEQADLIVAIGTGLNALVRQPIAQGLTRAKVALVNLDPTEAASVVDPVLVACADAAATLQGLLADWQQRRYLHGPVPGYALTRYTPTVTGAGNTEGELRQSEALAVLEPHLPGADHIVFDAGNCAAAALHHLTIPTGTTTTIALGMGGMGYAIAGAIGAQLGASSRRTIVITGDGSFLMQGLEVHTAVELGLPILFVVFNNGRHGMCVTRQQLYFDGRVECSQYAPAAIATIARGMGSPDQLWCATASSRHELELRLAEYEATSPRGPGVLELRLGAEEMPPFAPFLDGTAPTETVAVPTASARTAA